MDYVLRLTKHFKKRAISSSAAPAQTFTRLKNNKPLVCFGAVLLAALATNTLASHYSVKATESIDRVTAAFIHDASDKSLSPLNNFFTSKMTLSNEYLPTDKSSDPNTSIVINGMPLALPTNGSLHTEVPQQGSANTTEVDITVNNDSDATSTRLNVSTRSNSDDQVQRSHSSSSIHTYSRSRSFTD